jgi:hypothetical protein
MCGDPKVLAPIFEIILAGELGKFAHRNRVNRQAWQRDVSWRGNLHGVVGCGSYDGKMMERRGMMMKGRDRGELWEGFQAVNLGGGLRQLQSGSHRL